MSDFILSIANAKKLLEVFYNSPYHLSIPYVDMLHKLQEQNGNLTLKEYIDIEVETANKAQNSE
jgi:hypothetical protein